MKPNNQEFMRSFQKGEKELINKAMERARSGKTKGSDNQMDRPTNKLNSSTLDKGSEIPLDIQSPNTLFPLSPESLTPSGSHNHNQGQLIESKAIDSPFIGPDTYIPMFNYTKKKQDMDQLEWEVTMRELNIQHIKY